MRATTVRFSDDLWRLLEQESADAGVSAAQFVRDATVMRIAYVMGRRGEPAMESAMERVAPDASAAAPPGVVAAVRDRDRVQALRATGLLDTPADEAFDRHARIAAEALSAPVALVSLVDEDRQFFKSCLGLPEPWATRRGTPLSHSFCQHVVATREPLVIADARDHPVLKDNAAIRDLGVVAYAGMPLVDNDGHALGALCAIDHEPRHWSKRQVELLKDLAAGVSREIGLQRIAGAESAN
jgi:hypothetical protein